MFIYIYIIYIYILFIIILYIVNIYIYALSVHFSMITYSIYTFQYDCIYVRIFIYIYRQAGCRRDKILIDIVYMGQRSTQFWMTFSFCPTNIARFTSKKPRQRHGRCVVSHNL